MGHKYASKLLEQAHTDYLYGVSAQVQFRQVFPNVLI